MMDVPESNRSRSSKRDVEERIDERDSRIEDDERRDRSDKRKPRSNKSWKHNDEDSEEQDNKRRRNSGDRNDGRRKSGGSSRAGSGDEDDYDTRRDSRSKIPRKDLEERGELRLSEGYRDRDFDSTRKGRDDEHELNYSKKTSTRPSGHESSQSRTRSRAESSHGGEHEKVQDKESRSSDRKESSREKGHEHHEEERNPSHRRSDEADPGRTVGEISYIDRYDPINGKSSDNDKLETNRERMHDSSNEYGEAKSRVLDSCGEKDIRSTYREERKVTDSKEKDVRSSTIEEKMADGERFRYWGRSEAHDEHSRAVTEPCEARPDTVRDDRQRKVRERSVGLVEDADPSALGYCAKSPGEKGEKHRQQRGPACGSRDEVDSKERSVNVDEDGHTWMRDRSEREVRRNRRSRTPERSGRHHRELDEHDRGAAEYEKERSTGAKSKEWEQNYKDERSSKGKDRSWSDKNREREGSKDNRKITQFRHDTKDIDKEFDDIKECDSRKCEQERAGSEKLHSRPGYRKDSRIRPEGVKASLSLGNPNEQSDSIEIKLKNSNFVREESVSTFSGRRTEVGSQQDLASGAGDEEWGYPAEDRGTMTYNCGDDLQEKLQDEGSPVDQNPGRNSLDSRGANARGQKRGLMSGLQPPFGTNQGSGSFNRVLQGPKGGRPARGRRMSGRDAQRVGIPLAMMGPPFGHLGLPPGPMQPLGPTMSPGPSIGPGVLIPPFPGPLVWQGARGVDMNMVPVPPNLPPFPPSGPVGPRFAPNMGSSPNHPMYFNQPGTGRGAPSYTSGPGFSVNGPIGRETPHDKAPMNWVLPRNSGPSGKAPSRGEQNDYSQNFVDSGMRPQNFIRELELTNVVEDYPKLRELIQRKDEIVAKSASPPMYYKCDLHEFVLSAEFFGTKFDVILVDPPWEEYVHRAPGVTDHLECWSFEEIQNLKIEAIADNPSFIFLWVGDGAGLEQGRQCLKKWGFRRCEDICWVKTNKRKSTPGLRHDSRTLFQHSKEHCLMGIKGTVRRSTDGHIIHANIDTDIIIAEEPSDGSTKKPEDMYRIIEHFSLGRRRLELFGEDHNIRSGWLTVGKELSSSNFNTEAYIRNFADKDGKVWQGSGGRNPPPDTPHLVLTTPEIESLRPKSPPPKNQQQQQSMSLMTTGSSNSRRPSGNSPQTNQLASQSGLNQEGSVSEPGTPSPWVGLRGGPESGLGISDDKLYEGYGFSTSCMQGVGDHHDFDPHRAVNMM